MIYLDNAATTKISDTVLQAMMPYLTDCYGNPSTIYDLGSKSRDAIDKAREIIADSIGAKPDEIFFTSGGTESDTWALANPLFENPSFFTSAIEHHAVLNSCKYMHEKNDSKVEYIDVDEHGIICNVNPLWCYTGTNIFSVMFANNEIGTIQPIEELGEWLNDDENIFLHVDAVQAYGHIHINVNDMHIDFMSASGHKLYAPKGVGFLYARNGNIAPYIYGGGQERDKRSGTENVAGIVGFGQAVKEAMEHMDEWSDYEKRLRDHLIERVLNEIPKSSLNGHPTKRLPNNANFTFDGVNGESLVVLLNENGVCASTGSACSSRDSAPSHVLKAIGLSNEQARSSLRLTLSHNNTLEEIDYTVDILKQLISQLRSVNP